MYKKTILFSSFIIFVIIIGAIIMLNSNAHHPVQTDTALSEKLEIPENVDKIRIVNGGNGQHFYVEEENDIEKIKRFLETLVIEKKEDQQLVQGWSYSITLYHNNIISNQITFLGNSSCVYQKNYCIIKSSSENVVDFVDNYIKNLYTFHTILPENIEKIRIVNGNTGQEFFVTEEMKIRGIKGILETLVAEKKEDQQPVEGWGYSISLYSNGTVSSEFTFINDSLCKYQGNYYIIKSSSEKVIDFLDHFIMIAL